MPRSRVPAHTHHLLDCAEAGLTGIGFERVHTEAAEPLYFIDSCVNMKENMLRGVFGDHYLAYFGKVRRWL